MHCICYCSGDKHFTARKVPRQCPLVLLVKGTWKQNRNLGSEEGSVLEVDFWECAAVELHFVFERQHYDEL